jgi:hypothetical protein
MIGFWQMLRNCSGPMSYHNECKADANKKFVPGRLGGASGKSGIALGFGCSASVMPVSNP